MKRLHLLFLFVMVFVLALATAEAAKKAGKGKGRTISLTGCLQAGTEANTFTMTNISGAGAATKYEFVPGENVNLQAHVGHKVEITGMRVSAGKAMKMEHGKTAASKAERSEEKGEVHVKVTSLKHISPTCP